MNRSTYIFLFLAFWVNVTACKKSFLDVEDNSIIIRQQYVKDLKTTQQFLNGVYVVLSKDIYLYNNQIYFDIIADNIKPSPTNSSLLKNHYAWKQNPSSNSSNMDALWRVGYQLIRSCSFVIEKANELMNENPAKAKQMQGEAYGIRALIHFVLVNTFAQSYNYSSNGNHPGIPYIINSDWTDAYVRNTVAEVYSGIINDLNQALSLFPDGVSNTLVMNKQAVRSLLARVYLFKEDWQMAKTLAIEVANAVPLLPAESYPFKLFTLQETEALFQLAPSSVNVTSGGFDTNFQGSQFRGTTTYFLATKDIADLLTGNSNDSRHIWVSSGGIGKDSIRKYPIDIIPGFGTDSRSRGRSYYLTLLRSSEMFLTVAEAAAKTGDENVARTYLDAIRKRADPTAASSTAMGTALLDSIYLERRRELAFEGLRMFDLLRWKQGVNRTDVAIGGGTMLPYPSNKAIAPIPLIDVKTGIAQNTDY